MAIDKSRTKPWMKAIIIFICVTFVLSIAGAALGFLFNPTPTAPLAGSGVTGSNDTTAAVEAIANSYGPRIKAMEASASPDDAAANLAIAEEYFGWADAVLQTVIQAGGTTDAAKQAAQQQGFQLSAPYWNAAAAAYAKAFAKKSGDSSATTDYAISAFYSGDTTSAVKIAEELVAREPKFAPVRFNLGIFYANANEPQKAIAAFEEYLALEPNGQNVAAAKDMLSQLKK